MNYPHSHHPLTEPHRKLENTGIAEVQIEVQQTDDVLEFFLENNQFGSFVATTCVYKPVTLVRLAPLLRPGRNVIYIKAKNYEGGGNNEVRCTFEINFYDTQGNRLQSFSKNIRAPNTSFSHFYHGSIEFRI